MLVHSYIYYCLFDSLISDDQWQEWANELKELQDTHGWKINFYDEEFKDWKGDTGYHLPIPKWVKAKANMLLRMKETLSSAI